MSSSSLRNSSRAIWLLFLPRKCRRTSSFTTLLTEDDGLYNSASIAFGTEQGDRESVFITNFALLPPAPANSLGPAVLKLDVGAEGLALP